MVGGVVLPHRAVGKLNPLSLRASLAADGTSVRAEVSITLSSIPLLTLHMYPSPPQLPKCHCQPASLPLCPLVNFISLLIMQPANYSIFVTFSSIHCFSRGSFCETCVSQCVFFLTLREEHTAQTSLASSMLPLSANLPRTGLPSPYSSH